MLITLHEGPKRGGGGEGREEPQCPRGKNSKAL
jgi:hypothetical protein